MLRNDFEKAVKLVVLQICMRNKVSTILSIAWQWTCFDSLPFFYLHQGSFRYKPNSWQSTICNTWLILDFHKLKHYGQLRYQSKLRKKIIFLTLDLLSQKVQEVEEQIFDQWLFSLLMVGNRETREISEKTRKQAEIKQGQFKLI